MTTSIYRVLAGLTAAAALGAGTGPARATPQEYGAAMLKLATERGCMACHTIDPAPPRADGLPPIAPAWREVARRYRDDPAAHRRLTRIVLMGSQAGGRHWAGKVSDANMPPNAGAMTEQEAHRMVNWLLVLVP